MSYKNWISVFAKKVKKTCAIVIKTAQTLCRNGETIMYLWFISSFIAYFIKGLCGFANTLVFTSILSFGTSNANISPVDLLLGYPANILLIWKNGKIHIHSSKPLLAVIGILSGVLCWLFGIGVLLSAYVSRVTDSSSSFKANISSVFIIDNTFRIII